jgi:hypothetical protein
MMQPKVESEKVAFLSFGQTDRPWTLWLAVTLGMLDRLAGAHSMDHDLPQETPNPIPIRLGWLRTDCRVGDPVRFWSVEVSDAVPCHGGYELSVRPGKRWQTARVSESRIGEVSIGMANGIIEGGIWLRKTTGLIRPQFWCPLCALR